MKYLILRSPVIILFFALLSCIDHAPKIQPDKKLPMDEKGFAVIELFTSEGCSSCPAADVEVAEIEKQYPGNVYVLGFHVDYWNRLGWKDAFSDPLFSERQRGYATAFNLNGVYTPQVVVNGKYEFVGSDKAKMSRTVLAEIKTAPANRLQLEAAIMTPGSVQVKYTVSPVPGTELNIALVQAEATTVVKKGENAGRNLHHVNIVRNFKTIKNYAAAGELTMNVPTGVDASACKIISFVHEIKSRNILTVASVPVN
ncbi:MAG: DUF1223 domain-containing protein [Bacteroidota bacterium]